MNGDKLLYKFNNKLFYCEVESEDDSTYTVRFYGSKLPNFGDEVDKLGEGEIITAIKEDFVSLESLIYFDIVKLIIKNRDKILKDIS